MGVITTADELITDAKKLLEQAKEKLMSAYDRKTWGSESYGTDYMDEIWNSVRELENIIRKL